MISDIKSFAASKLGTIFWDTWYIRTFYQNSRIDFTVSKSRRTVKYRWKDEIQHMVSGENSKCLDFVSVQVKTRLQTRAFFSHTKQNKKMNHI